MSKQDVAEALMAVVALSDVETIIRRHNVQTWEDGGLKLRRCVCLDCGGTFQEGTHFHEAMTEERRGRVYHIGSRP